MIYIYVRGLMAGVHFQFLMLTNPAGEVFHWNHTSRWPYGSYKHNTHLFLTSMYQLSDNCIVAMICKMCFSIVRTEIVLGSFRYRCVVGIRNLRLLWTWFHQKWTSWRLEKDQEIFFFLPDISSWTVWSCRKGKTFACTADEKFETKLNITVLLHCIYFMDSIHSALH